MQNKFFSNQDQKIKLGGFTIEEIIKNHNFDIRDFTPYIPPKEKEINKTGTEVHYLGYYLKWDPKNLTIIRLPTQVLNPTQREHRGHTKICRYR